MNETTREISKLLKQAIQAEEENDLERAEHAYRRALAIQPEPGIWVLLAAVIGNELENRGDEAIQCLHEALALDPNYEEAHYDLGYDLRRKGDLESAIEHFRKALAIDPLYADAHAELGMALVRLSETGRGDADSLFGEALDHLERAVALDANAPKWRLYLAVTLWQADRLRQARVHYEAAVHLDPDKAATLGFYADFLSTAFGCRTEAELRFKRAIELDPEHPGVHYYFGKHLLRVGRHAEARRELLLADRLGDERALPLLQSSDDD